MIPLEDEGVRIIDKFNSRNLNFWKFKLEIELASMDL